MNALPIAAIFQLFLASSDAFSTFRVDGGICRSVKNGVSPFGIIQETAKDQLTYSSLLPPLQIRRGGRPRGPLRTFEVKPPMNEEIKQFKEVRVTTLNSDGKDEVIGIMPSGEALKMAKNQDLDLILINPNGDPPVCKIVEYSKYRYMKEKMAKEKKKNAKTSEIKEVKMSYKIDTHDYNVRMNTAGKFAIKGNRIKATVIFKGREQQHKDLGEALLQRFGEDLGAVCQMEGRPKQEGRNLSAFFNPKPEILKKLNEKKRQMEKDKKKKLKASKEALETAANSDKDPAAIGKDTGVDSNDTQEVEGTIDLISLLSDDDDDDLDEEDSELLASLGGSGGAGDDLFS